MQLAWATDIHLNFSDSARRQEFYGSVRRKADALLVSGDIAESPSIEAMLVEMDEALGMPVYFVLGNHDFFKGSIAETRRAVAQTCAARENLIHLSDVGAVKLTPETALIGHQGWGDARFGDFEGTEVMLNDVFLIEATNVRYI